MPRLLTFSSHWHLKFLLKNSGKKTLQENLIRFYWLLQLEAQQEVCFEKKLTVIKIFVKEFAILFKKYFIQSRCSWNTYCTTLCPRYSVRPAISIQKNVLSERSFFRHPEFLLQFIITNECSRASSVRAFVRNETIRMEATLRRTRSSIMRNAMSYRCAADNSSRMKHDRNHGVSSSARRNDTQLDFLVLLFVCGLKFLICPDVIDREPMYDQPIWYRCYLERIYHNSIWI